MISHGVTRKASREAAALMLVFIRHGEKPGQGLGLLTCRGLNRALKLPDYFAAHFPPPDYIFAPNPSVKVTEVHGDGQRYDCIRPLLTIAPTAVRASASPSTRSFPTTIRGLLADTILVPRYRAATIYFGWEHIDLDCVRLHHLLRRDTNA